MPLNLFSDDWSVARQGLRSLRSFRTPSVQSGSRASTFRTCLAQAEELWASADAVSTVASPILRYYAAMQAAQALIAASPLGNAEWRPRASHGVSVIVPEIGSLNFDDIRISAVGADGTAQVLSRALGSPLLREQASLLDLVAALPTQSLLSPHREAPAMALVVLFNGADPEIIIEGVPPSLAGTVERPGVDGEPNFDIGVLRGFLNRYPSLSKLSDPKLAIVHHGATPAEPDGLSLTWPRGAHPHASRWHELVDVWTWAGPNHIPDRGVALPSVAANEEAQHPFVTWYLVLFAFSILARYHSARWRHVLDVEKNREAVLLERLIDHDSAEAISLLQSSILGFAESDWPTK